MRKQQIKLLEKAKQQNCSSSQVALLSREDLKIQELDQILTYFMGQMKHIEDNDLLALEAEQCIQFLLEYKCNIPSDQYQMLLNAFFPYYYDTLLGNNNKRHIYNMYRFLSDCVKNNGESNVPPVVFHNYVDMLYENFPVWHRNTLLRAMLKDKEARINYLFFFEEYPCLLDNYLYNKKDSFFYHLVETKKIRRFAPTKNILEELYDYKNHQFCFKEEEFDHYFMSKPDYYGNISWIENKASVSEILIKRHPLVLQIAEFCKKNEMKPENKSGTIFTKWESWQLGIPRGLEKIELCCDILGHRFKIDMPASCLSINITPNCFVHVSYSKYTSISANAGRWAPASRAMVYNFMIAPDGRLFSKAVKTEKFVPLSLKTFVYLHQEINICGDFMKLLLQFHETQNVFYRDVIKDCLETQCLIPLNFNDVSEYHNRAELFLSKYKKASELKIKWNKQNINLSYLIIKSSQFTALGVSQQILVQQKDVSLLKHINSSMKYAEKVHLFLGQLIAERIMQYDKHQNCIEKIKRKCQKELSDEMQTDILSDELDEWINERIKEELPTNYDVIMIARDYTNMCIRTKKKIRLDVRSIRQLENLHNRVVEKSSGFRTITGEVKVPKKSKFLLLRDILPQEFEWIKTRKRLILETELQHHCVWSYAEKITADKCAIYSFVDTRTEYIKDGKPKRYTIEFGKTKDGAYYVEQVQGKYNKVNAQGIKEYVEMLLKKAVDNNKNSH